MDDKDPRNKLARASDLIHRKNLISWEVQPSLGSPSKVIHVWMVKLDGIERGVGQGSTIDEAKNNAARKALSDLRTEYPTLNL
ncbi:hypothetical protein CPB83DRAFT_861150 [Crepidotus variabilis]|uniref:DRBM domain-containing protein n=1 Tax=Crepidotus variabilis TaxID=179855 RepID=A0A9P6JLB2_9AGAR|nr:hypothetical protein CPB83DRAFT_861150 [Crepidotus variabilis]